MVSKCLTQEFLTGIGTKTTKELLNASRKKQIKKPVSNSHQLRQVYQPVNNTNCLACLFNQKLSKKSIKYLKNYKLCRKIKSPLWATPCDVSLNVTYVHSARLAIIQPNYCESCNKKSDSQRPHTSRCANH